MYLILFIIHGENVSLFHVILIKAFAVTSFTSFDSIHIQKFNKKLLWWHIKRETLSPQIISNIQYKHVVTTKM